MSGSHVPQVQHRTVSVRRFGEKASPSLRLLGPEFCLSCMGHLGSASTAVCAGLQARGCLCAWRGLSWHSKRVDAVWFSSDSPPTDAIPRCCSLHSSHRPFLSEKGLVCGTLTFSLRHFLVHLSVVVLFHLGVCACGTFLTLQLPIREINSDSCGNNLCHHHATT